ncbi:MAG: histidinol-phosphate transaminase [Candidatus Pelagibacter sp.]
MTQLKFRKINIESYRPGKSTLGKIKNLIKLSANESALGVSSRVKKINLKNLNIEKYPDSKCKALRNQIAKNFRCDFNKIICGSGSDEIIQMICQLFLNKNDEVILPKYSFLMYRIYAKIVGAKIIFSKEKNFKICVDDIIAKTSSKTKIVFLANPNNPTGTYLNFKELKNLRKKLNKKILLVIDDAYFEYMTQKDYISGLKLFKNNNNVFILRTFSKVYGLASLRVGWGYGSKKIIDELYKIKPPFNVNRIAQLSAIEALKDYKFIKKSVRHNFNWSVKIKKFLENKNIKTNQIAANFFLLDFDSCKKSANYVAKKLENKGIILRSMENYKMKNKLRMTIGSTTQNIKFIKEIKNILR